MTYEQSDTAKAVKMCDALAQLADEMALAGKDDLFDILTDIRKDLPVASLAKLYSLIKEA